VGLQLFCAAGPEVVRALHGEGRRVFLDLKFHDIPNTVARAVESATELGVAMLTLHTSGGAAMLRAARESLGSTGPQLFAVTVLTSLNADPDEVTRRAEIAVEAGIDGVVASVHEAEHIRRNFGHDLAILSPGIRLARGDAHDQVRVATPAEAARAGVEYVVLGRAVTASDDPAARLAEVCSEFETFEDE
jgi:orotidine-5'-phosphate decarboxylase